MKNDESNSRSPHLKKVKNILSTIKFSPFIDGFVDGELVILTLLKMIIMSNRLEGTTERRRTDGQPK